MLQKHGVLITNAFVLGNSGSIDAWHILKRGRLFMHIQSQLYHWYFDFQWIIYSSTLFDWHSQTWTFDECAHYMSTDNKRYLVLFNVTAGLPTENEPKSWPLALERLLIMVILFMQNLMSNQPLVHHLCLSNTKLAVLSFFHAIT